MTLAAGQAFDYTTTGSWKIAADSPELTADGDSEGRGRLEAVIMTDHQLSPPFALAAEGSFATPSAGNLYYRCADPWNKLDDNSGKITVRLKHKREKARP
jgi:hypothetical protein